MISHGCSAFSESTSAILRRCVSECAGARRAHLEQAIFADELFAIIVAKYGNASRCQWKALLTALVPEIQALINAIARRDVSRISVCVLVLQLPRAQYRFPRKKPEDS